ncbi:hypothetical protein A1OQ_14460 [Enterovibrio norvegicus FF-162]|uniref:pilin n=1 Tax=Enterovibrio norvegicus TaxID=188144 RepID=UPI0002D65590|nr:pilin [Enterovibrio norvegicus]OEE87699.1 hypothetical protein A1OQ_14460 [Enterovibrio norvegicus FF-162]
MRKQKGFSLIELLIVVGIIGAISAIAVPAYSNYKKKSDVTAAVATVKSLLTKAELHLSEKSTNGMISFVTALDGAKNAYNTGLGTIVGVNGVTEVKDSGGTVTTPGVPATLTFTFGAGQAFEAKTVTFTRGNEAWSCALQADISSEFKNIKGCS